MALAFNLQTDINQIFQMRYCLLLQVRRLQKYQRSKLEVEKNLPDRAGRGCISLESGRVGNFLWTSNYFWLVKVPSNHSIKYKSFGNEGCQLYISLQDTMLYHLNLHIFFNLGGNATKNIYMRKLRQHAKIERKKMCA